MFFRLSEHPPVRKPRDLLHQTTDVTSSVGYHGTTRTGPSAAACGPQEDISLANWFDVYFLAGTMMRRPAIYAPDRTLVPGVDFTIRLDRV